MIFSLNAKSAAATLVLAASAAFATQASANTFRTDRTSPPSTFGFAASPGGPGTASVVQACSGVAACAALKQACSKAGWEPTATNGSGKPTSGTCSD